MRKIITTTFMTLDGVIQAPGGPDEDRTGGFAHGGWQFHYHDEMQGAVLSGYMKPPFELLLGRRTYDIWAAYWPHTKEAPEIAEKFNGTKKFVVSHLPLEPSWKGTTSIHGDVVPQLRKLKEMDGPDLWVWGSANLIQTLMKVHLIDRMHVWTFPLTVGRGKRLFAGGTQVESFKLLESKTSTTGVIIATYEPAGPLKTGSLM